MLRPLYPRERKPHSTLCIGVWVALDYVERRKIVPLPGLKNSDLSVVQPIASPYTYCAIPALVIWNNKVNTVTGNGLENQGMIPAWVETSFFATTSVIDSGGYPAS
jgi:hypothetical protein